MAVAMPPSVGLLYWYTTSAILGLLALLNLVKITYRYITRPRPTKFYLQTDNLTPIRPARGEITLPPSPGSDSSFTEKGSDVGIEPARSSLVKRLGNAMLIGWEKYVLLTALPVPRPKWLKKRRSRLSFPTSELACNLAYLAVSLVLLLEGTAFIPKRVVTQAGWLAVAQVPLIVSLSGKNNLVSFLTGISYERLNFLHRASGKVCLLMVWVHGIGHLVLNRGLTHKQWHKPLIYWGVTGVIAFTLMVLCTMPIIRHRLYEFFLVTHICLAALSLGAFIMHWKAVDIWVYPGIGLWAADRLFRIIRLIVLNRLYPSVPVSKDTEASRPSSTATLTLLTPSTLKITFPTPSHLSWQAGQHFYIIMPGMSRLPWEAHPFTATTIQDELTFIVRVRDGFTKMMKDKVDEERKRRGVALEDGDKVGLQVRGVVEGPYGKGRDLSRFDGVILVAGGSGISFAVAHLLQVIRDTRQGKTRVQHVKIVWMVKSRLHLNWISPILLANCQDLPPSLNISIHIHVTKQYIPRPSLSLPPQAVLPENPTEQETADWQTYMAKRAADPTRRRSRLMSTFSWASWTSRAAGLTGPGTRRGSEAIITKSGRVSFEAKPRVSGSSAGLDVDVERGDVEKEMVAIPTFTWSEGYDDAFPGSAQDVKEVDFTTDFGPTTPKRVKRLASEVPSIGPLTETHEDDDDEKYDSSPDSPAFPAARISTDSEPSPFSTALRGRRSISFLDVDPNAGSRSSTPPRPPRRTSITIDEPIHPRRKSTSGLAPSPLGSRNNSLIPSPTMLTVNLQPGSPAQQTTYLEASPVINQSTPLVHPQPHPGHLILPTSTIDTPHLTIPSLPSGAGTPALTIQADLANPQATLDQAFAATTELRRRQSIGLETLIHWHEGRADLTSVVSEMMQQVKVEKGGWVDVSACGPRSLLESSKEVVRGLSSVGGTLRGGGGVRFSAETFGW